MMLGALLVILLLTLLFSFLRLLLHRSRFNHLPGPVPDSWISGHVNTLLRVMRKEGHAYSVRMEWSTRFPDLYVVWLFTTAQVCLTDGAHIQTYFSQPQEKFLYPFLSYCMGYRMCGPHSIFNDPGTPLWARKRRTFKRFFSQQHSACWVEQIAQHTARLVTVVRREGEVDMADYMKRLTFDIVSDMALGFHPRAVERDAPIRHSIDQMLSIGFENAFSVVKNNVPFLNLNVKRRLGAAVRASRSYCRDLVEERRRVEEGKRVDDILSMIIECNGDDVEAMIDDVVVFLIAGYDTAANVLGFTIALLIEHPDSLQRVMEEVGGVDVQDSGCSARVPYLNACLSESMRLFPPGPVSHRVNNKPARLGEYTVPGGCQIQACVFVQHRLPRYWHRPNSFLPERWLRDITRDVTTHVTPPRAPFPGSYLPFMIGPRDCVGKNMAVVLLRVVLCALFKEIGLEKVGEERIKPRHCFTLIPDGRVMARVVEKTD